MISTIRAFGVCGFVLLIAGTVAADEILFFAAPADSLTVTSVVEQPESQLQMEMALLLDELDRVCGLSAEQKQKLHVAAKGAIQKILEPHAAAGASVDLEEPEIANLAIAEHDARLAALAEQMKLRARRADAERAALAELAKAKNIAKAKAAEALARAKLLQAKIDEAQIQIERDQIQLPPEERANFLVRFRGLEQMATTSPAEQAIWVKAVRNVLTPEQQNLYKKSRSDRSAFKESAIIHEITSVVDAQLKLTDDQHAKLKDLIKASANDRTRRPGITSVWENSRNMQVLLPHLPPDELRQLLTEMQLKKWANFSPDNSRFFGFSK